MSGPTTEALSEAVRLARGEDSQTAFLERLGLGGISKMNVSRWERGEIRNRWVPVLLEALSQPKETAIALLAERLDLAVPETLDLLGRLDLGAASASVVSKALGIESKEARHWILLATA